MANRRRPHGKPMRQIKARKRGGAGGGRISARQQRLSAPARTLFPRWRIPVLVALIAFVVLICEPASFRYVLPAVIVIFILLSLANRLIFRLENKDKRFFG